jgi:hypothetical protein
MLIPREFLRPYGAGLQASQQEQDDQDYDNDAYDATGTVAPAASVRPRGQDADKDQYQDDQQNGAKTHDLLLLSIE